MEDRRTLFALVLGVLVLGCEPETITEARDQLNRGGERIVRFSVAIKNDTITIGKFLPEEDTVTTSSGLVGIKIDVDTVTVDVGDKLQFEDLNFDTFSFSYDQMLQTTETSTSLTVPSSPATSGPAMAVTLGTVRFTTDSGSAVTGATIGSGFVHRLVTNNTSCTATVPLTVTDSLGATVGSFSTLVVGPMSAGEDSADAAGANLEGFVNVDVSGTSFGACVPSLGDSVGTVVTFRPFSLSSVRLENVNEPFADTYAALASESRIQAVDTVIAESGSFVVTVLNKLPIQISVDLEVAGVVKNGSNLSGIITVPAAPGDGSTVSAQLTLPLSGDTIVAAQVVGMVNGSAVAAQATITAAAASDAVVVDAVGSVVVQSMIGSLDPDSTPELIVSVESFEEFDNQNFDFGDFEDAVRDATLNDAVATLTLKNRANVPIVLSNLVLGAALLDATGDIQRDSLGDPIFESDGAGVPILVPVVDPGMTTLSIARLATTSVDIQVNELADRLVKLALDDSSVAIVAKGTATAGDGSSSSINRNDGVDVAVGFVVGLDLTIPASGILFSTTNVETGAELDSADAEAVAARLSSATVIADVVNGTPFGVEVELAYVEGDRGDSTDVFLEADRVTLNTVTVDAPTVDANGLVQQPISDSAVLTVDSAQVRGLLGDLITMTVRVRLLPGSGGGGRGAVRSTDEIIITARAEIELRSGGGGRDPPRIDGARRVTPVELGRRSTSSSRRFAGPARPLRLSSHAQPPHRPVPACHDSPFWARDLWGSAGREQRFQSCRHRIDQEAF